MKLFANKPRKERVRNTYIVIALGIAVAAFLIVLISRRLLLWKLEGLYDKQGERHFSLEEGTQIGSPLSLSTRLELLKRCEIEGPERLPLPEELSKKEALGISQGLFEELIMESAGDRERFYSGDEVNRILSDKQSTAVLRDYFNERSGARLSLWCTQVFYESVSGQTLCLSLMLDSLSGQPFYMNAAFFGGVGDEPLQGVSVFLQALGEAYASVGLEGVKPVYAGTEYSFSLPLGEGVVLEKHCQKQSQFSISIKYEQF